MTFLPVFALRKTSKNKGMDVYAQLVFLEGDIRFEDSSHPIPNWPFQSLESLQALDQPASSGTLSYFNNLTTGQFLCIIHTAKNFEAYSLTVKKESTCGTLWYEIMTMWLCHFTNSLLECNALRALYNRRHKRFVELQKRFHVRGDSRVKDDMILFLNSKLVLPKKKNVLYDSQQSSQQSFEILNNVPQMEEVSRSAAAKNNSFNEVLLEKNKLKKISTAQATVLKKKTAALCTVGQENKQLRNLVNEQSRQLKMIGPESKSSKKEVDKLRARNKLLNQKTKVLRDLTIKLKFQQHKMDTVNTEMSRLTKVAADALEGLDEKENERIKMEKKLTHVKKALHNTKKKVQRRNRNICELHEKVEAARNKFETDKNSIELYFTGIVDSLKNLHKLSVDSLNQRLEEMKQLETKKGGI